MKFSIGWGMVRGSILVRCSKRLHSSKETAKQFENYILEGKLDLPKVKKIRFFLIPKFSGPFWLKNKFLEKKILSISLCRTLTFIFTIAKKVRKIFLFFFIFKKKCFKLFKATKLQRRHTIIGCHFSWIHPIWSQTYFNALITFVKITLLYKHSRK